MIELLQPQIEVQRRLGGWVLSSRSAMPAEARCVGDWLVQRAAECPKRTFVAQRDADGGWVECSYGEALEAIEGIGSALLDMGGRPDRPVMLLSGNSIASALLMLGAMHAGLPVAPVSSAYSLLSTSFARLRDVAGQLRPGFLFVEDPEPFSAALGALQLGDATVLSANGHAGTESLASMSRRGRSAALESAFADLGPDTIAKVLFTSGSTGHPKGVINTQRMLTSNQASIAAIWPFLRTRPPVVVDWLPWSHTFGGNHNFFLILRNGGTLHIDRGRPAPGMIETTLANMADVSPTLWFNVPRGFDQAVAVLEREPALASAVFEQLDMVFYAAAALAPSTRTRLEQVADKAGRPGVFFTSSWGSTETAPLATSAHFPTRTTGILGVPVPGVDLKLAPVQDRLELRVRGPNVTPGYWQPGGDVAPVELDDEGFLPTGDAGRLVDEARPEAGVVFVGRLSENFKLSSGTWVNVGQVRLKLVDACAPLVQDAVIAGHDRDRLGALVFLAPSAAEIPPDELRARLTACLRAHNEAHPGNSERIGRALVMTRPLSLDEGETTDKGYTNQRRVLERRRGEVQRLFADPADAEVYVLDQ